jgi:hypothetical protein
VAEKRGEAGEWRAFVVGSQHSSGSRRPALQPTPAGLQEEEERTAVARRGAEEEENGRRREGRQAAAEGKREILRKS